MRQGRVEGFRLAWRPTWPDGRRRDDYCGWEKGRDDRFDAVRIFLDGTTPDQHGRWRWCANAPSRFIANGFEATARAAAMAGEAAFWRWREARLKAEIRARLASGLYRRP